ncbi:MAG: PilZ domain-containing protein [Bdellovibrionota bacterium]
MQTQNQNHDRRRHLRIRLEQEVLVERENFEGIETMTTFNLSPAGACIQCEKKMNPGQIVYLEIQKDHLHIDCIPSMGEVKWVKQASEDIWLNGIEFRGISAKFKNRIHSLILSNQGKLLESTTSKVFPSEDSQEQLIEYLEKSDPQEGDPLESFPDMEVEIDQPQDLTRFPQDTLLDTTSLVKALRNVETSSELSTDVEEFVDQWPEEILSDKPSIQPWMISVLVGSLILAGGWYAKDILFRKQQPSIDELFAQLYQNSTSTTSTEAVPVKNLPGSQTLLEKYPIDLEKPSTMLRNLVWKSQDHRGTVTIETNGNTKDLKVRTFLLTQPTPRKVYVFSNLSHEFDQKVFPIGAFGVSQVRLGRHEVTDGSQELHVVLDLSQPNTEFELKQIDQNIVIDILAK